MFEVAWMAVRGRFIVGWKILKCDLISIKEF